MDRVWANVKTSAINSIDDSVQFRTFDSIGAEFFENLGDITDQARHSVAFNDLENTLFAISKSEAKKYEQVLRAHDITQTHKIRVVGAKDDGKIDVLSLTKKYAFQPTVDAGRAFLRTHPNSVAIIDNGIVLHSNGLIQCGYSDLFDRMQIKAKAEWDVADCLNIQTNRVYEIIAGAHESRLNTRFGFQMDIDRLGITNESIRAKLLRDNYLNVTKKMNAICTKK